MSNWVFNILQNHSRISIIPPQEIEFDADILVEDFSNTFRAQNGDNFLTLNKNGTYYFDNKGQIIDEATTIEIAPSDEDIKNFSRRKIPKEKYPKKYRHRAKAKLIPIHAKLEDYTYSLLAIENYGMPYNHFKKKYTSLSSNDYQTIIQGIFFISRTVFGRLFNCLPRENQFEILLNLSESYPVEKLRELGFINPILFLRNYIQENIIESGKYLVHSNNSIKRILEERQEIHSEIGFIEDEFSLPDKLSIQAGYFEELFGLEYDLELINELTDQIQQNKEIEERFEKLFKKRKWPINVSL
jgi:hypothetical protein